jgi:general secretion pathway protein G
VGLGYNVIGMYKIKKGFTLLELLVVIGMLGVLSAAVISIIGVGPKQYARDTRRKADLESIRSAIEMYRNDQGYYPTCANAACIAPTYISTLPTDPQGGNYTYSPGAACGAGVCTYSLSAHLEKEDDPDYPTYTVTNP